MPSDVAPLPDTIIGVARVRGEFEYDDDLTPGRTDDDGWSGLLFKEGERGVVDHGVFYPDADYEPDEEDEPSETFSPDWGTAAVGAAVGGILTYVVVAGTPRVKRWWNEEALPAIRRKWKAVSTSRESEVNDLVQTLAEPDASQAGFVEDVEALLKDPRAPMSSSEARERLLMILLAAALIAEQMRALHNARIESGEEAVDPVLQRAMARLTTQEVTDSVNRMLEADTSLLTDDSTSRLMEYFGGGLDRDGQYVPLTNARVKDALRLTDIPAQRDLHSA